MLMVLWTVDTSDYRLPGTCRDRHTRSWRARSPGAIILLHDAGGNRSETVAALPKIIARLRARGYKLVTVPAAAARQPGRRANQQISSVIGTGG